MSIGGQQGNIYEQAAQNLGDAGLAARTAGMMFANPGTIAEGMAAYRNPWEDEVIARTADAIRRQTAMQQAQVGAMATGAGAFGGSRHGIVEAQTNAAAQRSIGDLAAQLRAQGFNTAAALAASDLDRRLTGAGGLLGAAGSLGALGGQQFGMGQQVQANQRLDGLQLQAMNQQLLDDARAMFEQYVNQPQNLLALRTAAASGSPLNLAVSQTTTQRPGLLNFLGLGLQALGVGFPGGFR
jgi:hypothetical protein